MALRVLIVGECGDGKSTLLNNLLGLTGAQAATTGRSARGVTKQLAEYSTDKQINGKVVVFLDSPGVGDMDVTAVQLLSLIEENLSSHHHRSEDALDALIVTTPSSDARIKLGVQVVQTLVEKGFIGPDKWKNVILNGTKMDRADPEDITFFKEEISKAFFGADVCQNGSVGQTTLTSLDDTSQIWMALENLPASKVIYQKPDVEEMSKALAAKLGVDDEIFKEQLNQERLRADDNMKEAVAAKAKALQEEERANKEEQARKAADAKLAQEEKKANKEQQARKAADAKVAQEEERANKEQQARKAADAKAAQEAARANQIAAAAKKAKEEAETAAVKAAQKAKADLQRVRDQTEETKTVDRNVYPSANAKFVKHGNDSAWRRADSANRFILGVQEFPWGHGHGCWERIDTTIPVSFEGMSGKRWINYGSAAAASGGCLNGKSWIR